jgi:hypothetical protein
LKLIDKMKLGLVLTAVAHLDTVAASLLCHLLPDNICSHALDFCLDQNMGFSLDIGYATETANEYIEQGKLDGDIMPVSEEETSDYKKVRSDTYDDAVLHSFMTAMLANYANCDIGLYCYSENGAKAAANQFMDARETCLDDSVAAWHAKAAKYMDINNNRVGAEIWRSSGHTNFFGLWQEPSKDTVWRNILRARRVATFYNAYPGQSDVVDVDALRAVVNHQYDGTLVYFKGPEFRVAVSPTCPPSCTSHLDCAACPGTTPRCSTQYHRLRNLLRAGGTGDSGGTCADVVDTDPINGF